MEEQLSQYPLHESMNRPYLPIITQSALKLSFLLLFGVPQPLWSTVHFYFSDAFNHWHFQQIWQGCLTGLSLLLHVWKYVYLLAADFVQLLVKSTSLWYSTASSLSSFIYITSSSLGLWRDLWWFWQPTLLCNFHRPCCHLTESIMRRVRGLAYDVRHVQLNLIFNNDRK